MANISAIILAAGKGTRMKSKKPKILHHVAGKPMIRCIIDQLKKFKLDKIVIVVGDKESMHDHDDPRIKYVIQKAKLGTAHAVMQAEKELKGYKGKIKYAQFLHDASEIRISAPRGHGAGKERMERMSNPER